MSTVVATKTYEAEAEAGAAFLDDVNPGWASRIDRAHLSMSDGGCCVVGQLYTTYGLGIRSLLGPHNAWLAAEDLFGVRAQSLGFCIDMSIDMSIGAQDADWSALQAAWLIEIDHRLEGAP